MLTKTLIVGDSFAAPITGADHAWHSCIGPVKNCARAGVGQYKILQQILNNYDHETNVIIVITSQNRIHVEKNPFYSADHHHADCDLIFSDVDSRNTQIAQHVTWWFSNVFDLEHAKFMNNLLLEKMHCLVKNTNLIPVTFFEPYQGMYDFDQTLLDLSDIWNTHPGEINHLDPVAHQQVADIIRQKLK